MSLIYLLLPYQRFRIKEFDRVFYFSQREKQERQQQQRTVRAKLREKRQVSARARRYYDEYELRTRARMLKRRTREEQVTYLANSILIVDFLNLNFLAICSCKFKSSPSNYSLDYSLKCTTLTLAVQIVQNLMLTALRICD